MSNNCPFNKRHCASCPFFDSKQDIACIVDREIFESEKAELYNGEV